MDDHPIDQRKKDHTHSVEVEFDSFRGVLHMDGEGEIWTEDEKVQDVAEVVPDDELNTKFDFDMVVYVDPDQFDLSRVVADMDEKLDKRFAEETKEVYESFDSLDDILDAEPGDIEGE